MATTVIGGFLWKVFQHHDIIIRGISIISVAWSSVASFYDSYTGKKTVSVYKPLNRRDPHYAFLYPLSLDAQPEDILDATNQEVRSRGWVPNDVYTQVKQVETYTPLSKHTRMQFFMGGDLAAHRFHIYMTAGVGLSMFLLLFSPTIARNIAVFGLPLAIIVRNATMKYNGPPKHFMTKWLDQLTLWSTGHVNKYGIEEYTPNRFDGTVAWLAYIPHAITSFVASQDTRPDSVQIHGVETAMWENYPLFDAVFAPYVLVNGVSKLPGFIQNLAESIKPVEEKEGGWLSNLFKK